MTDANELTGRELAVACARAMGWHRTERGSWFNPQSPVAHVPSAGPNLDEALAWLHERGIVTTASSHRVTEASFVAIPSMESLEKWVRGSNLTEALQRLVVAVAQRGSGGRT